MYLIYIQIFLGYNVNMLVRKGVNDCCLTPSEKYTLQWDDDDVCIKLDQHA
jgi:hypothetical protein